MAKDKRIRFPSGSYQAFYKGISYKIDPENDTVEMTQRLNTRYSPESREEAVNLANKHGIKKIQNRASLFSKLLLLSILLFLFLMFFPPHFSVKPESFFLSTGKFLTIVSEVVFLYMFGYYRAAVNYCTDSYCEKCGKHFVFEEFQAPLVKEESKNDSYLKTLTQYWHCRNCGHEDIKVEPQPIDHHYEKKQSNLEDTCEECGKEHAIEEYRNIDVLNYVFKKKIRYFKCRNCGYHEIRLTKRF